jgi:hypothetical protein
LLPELGDIRRFFPFIAIYNMATKKIQGISGQIGKKQKNSVKFQKNGCFLFSVMILFSHKRNFGLTD